MTHPTPAEAEQARFDAGLSVALKLVDAVHEPLPQEAIRRIIDGSDVYAVMVALAALVPVDNSPRELLAWAERPAG